MRVGNTIYLDHQATTPVDERVLNAMAPYYREQFANPHSNDHILGWKAKSCLESASLSIADFIAADPDEIIFTSGATEANNLAILGLARSARRHRTRILVSAVEHKCILAAARAANELSNISLETISVDHEGKIDLASLEQQLADDVLLVSVMAVNNEIGTIQPLEQIGRLAESHGAFFHCDAAQAPIAMRLNVETAGIHMLSLSGHKIYGPKGIGCLYIRRDIQEYMQPIIHGGGQQSNIRSGTVPIPLCMGLASAIALIDDPNYEQERRALAERRDRFVELVRQTGHAVTVNGPPANRRHPGNASIQFSGFAAADLLNVLQPHIAAATGSACTSGTEEPSYVLRAIGLTTEQANASIRFSLGRDTVDTEIEEATDRIAAALAQLDNITG